MENTAGKTTLGDPIEKQSWVYLQDLIHIIKWLLTIAL